MSRNKLKFLLLPLLLLCLAAQSGSSLADSNAPASFWKYQCIDTVKYSRDTARNWVGKDAQLQALINQQMSLIKNTGANCVAIDTPYDPEFVPFLSKWVSAARSNGLTVWFRGNLSGWEGWFNYPLLTSASQQNTGVYQFITQNPQIFADGDIFTPAPEPENGILGNPFSSPQAAQNLRDFLASSYANCQSAFATINKKVNCGFFSTNGDVAKDILTKQTVQSDGNLVVVDDYVKTADQLGDDLQNLNNEFGTNVVLGEFGAPIPDIHGNLTESQQAQLIDQMLNKAYQEDSFVIGVDYWVLAGGSTALINDDGSTREVYQTIKDYYSPGKANGTVYNDAGDKLQGVKISPDGGDNFTMTDGQGNFSLLLPADHQATITAALTGYTQNSGQVTVGPAGAARLNIILHPTKPSIFYVLKKFFRSLDKKL